MYRVFKPIQPIEVSEEKEEKTQHHIQEPEHTDDARETFEKEGFMRRIQELEKEAESLKEQGYALSRERDELKAKLEEVSHRLEEELRRKEFLSSIVEALKDSIKSALEEKKFNVITELLDILKKALEVMLDSPYFPHQEALVKAFSKVFEMGIDIKGEVSVRVSPTDFELVSGLFRSIVEELGDKLDLQISEDKGLRAGEFVIESPKFWIERKREEVIEDALMKVLGGVQDIQ